MLAVTLTADIHPWRRGDRIPLPEPVARKLAEIGEAINLKPWPEPELLANDIYMTPVVEPDTADLVTEPEAKRRGRPSRSSYVVKG